MTTKITEKNISNIANAAVQWQSVVVADGSTGLTAVAGRGYFINTTSGAQTVTLPTSANVGDVIVLKDYARTWATNAVSIASALFDGFTTTATFSTNGQTVTLVYMDNTRGWSLINEDTTTGLGAVFITATGGTITTSGDYKIHTFTGDGSFVVSSIGNQSDKVDYLVVAGGGGTGDDKSGGGGAGGFRESKDSTINSPHTASPLAATTGITVTATTFPITVGAGAPALPNSGPQVRGSDSVFSTITSTGGGAGGVPAVPFYPGQPGGSGGGGRSNVSAGAGTGNTPPTSPSQGNPGGSTAGGSPAEIGAGGGGAGGAGAAGQPGGTGIGGAGATTSISGSPTTYAGGGGGGGGGTALGAAGGSGGGGTGGSPPLSPSPALATAGTANTGGGGGGGSENAPGSGRAGGKGIVIIRYKFQ